MQRSIATVSLSGTLPEKLEAIAAAGFDGVEIFENDLLHYDGSPRDVRRLCADLGLEILLFQPFRDFEGCRRERLGRNLERAERKFDLMQELGTDLMLVCSNVAADALGEPALLADDLRQLAERAAVRGLRIGYEALAWGRQVNTWEQAWDLVRRADQANLGLILDSFHTLSLDGDPRGIADLPGKRSSSCRWPTRPCWQWTCWNGAGTSAASRVRAASTWQASSRRSSRPAIAVRCRWRSSTTASAPRRPAPTPSTACARCSTSRRRPASACTPDAARGGGRAVRAAAGEPLRRHRVPRVRRRRDARRAPWPVVAATGLRQGRRAPFEECQPVAPGRHQPGTERRALFLRPRFLRGPRTVLVRHRAARA